MALEFTPDEQAFRALVVHRLAEAMRPCLDEAMGQNIRERAAFLIVSRELLKLASLYGMQLGWSADEVGGLARDCFNEVASLSNTEAGGLKN
jgi:hypothetical protein